MAKKNFRHTADDPFDSQNPSEQSTPNNSWVQTDSQIFGDSSIFNDLAAADAAVERVKAVSIFSIQPDSTQPRRAVPTIVRKTWDGTAMGVADMLKVWWGAAQDERKGRPFDLGAYLVSDETERSDGDFKPGPIESAFMSIITLAASIRRDGLTNPVTVAPVGSGQYQLETGERRWLAYHLLYAWFDGHEGRPNEQNTWAHIPTRQVKEVDVWRQANENNARANLNAISKARQLAVLLMDLNGRANFRPFHTFDHEHHYYAQAVDYRAPDGMGEQLMNAMGVNSRATISYYRGMLRLPDKIWEGGDDLNLPEEILYKLSLLPEHEALERYEQIVAERAGSGPKSPVELPKADYAPGTKRHFAQMARAVTRAAPGKHDQNERALEALRELRDWIDEQEQRINRFNR